jgi:hypothetical protein
MPPKIESTAATFRGEETGRVQRVVHAEMAEVKSEVEDSMKTVKRMQMWGALALTVAGLGFGTAMYLGRYATAVDLDKLTEKHEAIHVTLQNHIVVETGRLVTLETLARRADEDRKWEHAQMRSVADRVGAARVAAPPKTALPERTAP